MPLLGKHKQTRLHVDSAELCNTARELEVGLYALQDSHVCKANLSDEFEFGVLRENGNSLCDLEHGADNVVARVARVPMVAKSVYCVLDVTSLHPHTRAL
jgi:hypothetical protein